MRLQGRVENTEKMTVKTRKDSIAQYEEGGRDASQPAPVLPAASDSSGGQ